MRGEKENEREKSPEKIIVPGGLCKTERLEKCSA